MIGRVVLDENDNKIVEPLTGGSGKDVYSTTEKIIGTWIDGRPVYQKTLNIGNVARGNSINIAHGVTNFDRLLTYYGFCNLTGHTNSYKWQIPQFNNEAESGAHIAITSTDSTNVTITTDWALSNTVIILEYIKTA